MRLALVLLAIVLTACSGRSGAAQPTETPTPEPTPKPWSLRITDFAVQERAREGREVLFSIAVENSGDGANERTELQVSGHEDLLDLIGCKPKCTYHDGFGGLYLDMPGVDPGDERVYSVQFLATDKGVADLFVCVNDEVTGGDQVGCEERSVVIR